MKKILLLFFALLLLPTCDKEKEDLDFRISGRVLDAGTQEPIQGVEIYVIDPYVACLGCPVKCNELDRSFSDENGEFVLSARLEKESQGEYAVLKLQALPEGYQQAYVDGFRNTYIASHEGYEDCMGAFVNDDGTYLIELLR